MHRNTKKIYIKGSQINPANPGQILHPELSTHGLSVWLSSTNLVKHNCVLMKQPKSTTQKKNLLFLISVEAIKSIAIRYGYKLHRAVTFGISLNIHVLDESWRALIFLNQSQLCNLHLKLPMSIVNCYGYKLRSCHYQNSTEDPSAMTPTKKNECAKNHFPFRWFVVPSGICPSSLR